MRTRFWTLFLLVASTPISVISVSAQSALSGLPFVRSFHPLDYGAGIQNLIITQDRRGLLYVANNFGLLEYDGNQWQTYGVKNGTKVRSVAVDDRGRIYVGCQADFGYFFPDAQGKLVYTSLADSLPAQHRNFDEAWSIYIDKEKVFFCTFSKVYIYNGKKLSVAEPPAPLDLSFLVNRQLYINVRDKGIAVMEGEQIRMLKGGTFFAGMSISAILPLHSHGLLVSTFRNGIFVWEGETIRPWNDAQQPFFKEATINGMIRLRNGNFAVGTQNEGLLILNPAGQLLMHMTSGRGLQNRTVLSLYEDDLNNIWIGQNNALAYIELGSSFTFLNEQVGLPGTGYAAYLDGARLYMGTNTGLYEKVSSSVLPAFRGILNTRGQVYHLGHYTGELLMGHHNGAQRIDNGAGIRVSPETGSWVFRQMRNRPDRLIEGTYTGLQCYTRVNGHWKLLHKIPGFNESSRVMEFDDTGHLWVTHGYKGAYRITLSPGGDSIRNIAFYGKDKGFPSNLLINVFRIRNELLFTGERGVYRYHADTDSFVPDDLFTRLLGPNAQIWYMQEDALGNIYFVGREYMGVMRKNAVGDYTLEDKTFPKIRKYLNDDLGSITILQNNEVLFGAKDGFIHYDPSKHTGKASLFNTLIRKVSVTAGGDSILFHGNYHKQGAIVDMQGERELPALPYARNAVSFTFAATSYEGNADVAYQYYLENYEQTWSDWSPKMQKEYTNLKEGRYRFHVRARNVNGEVSAEAVYGFTIAPPWYRSMLAYGMYGISILALLFLGFRLLDRKYQREQKVLEHRQQEELNRKENELEKLSQQSQEAINRLQHERLESDLRHMNNELATATMHLLNKNEFITGIKNTLLQIVRKTDNDESRRELQQITRNIEQNISADSDWEHFQFHFDRVHGDFTGRFRTVFPTLSPQDIKLSAYLRMNLSTKEIAQLLNISVRGVEISRYRLRKKLQLDRTTNLQEFILNF